MNLKESYRYANYLDKLLNESYAYLRSEGFVTTVKETHLKSKVNEDAVDETIDVKKSYDVDFKPNDVIDFIVDVIAEKRKLVNAIAIAKLGTEINIDNAISMNKTKQRFVHILQNMSDIKSEESTVKGVGYKFNQEGNQVKYFYDVEKVVSIDFKRDDVIGLIKKYNKECDAVSSKLDLIEITTEVDYTPLFDVNDSLEDCIINNR